MSDDSEIIVGKEGEGITFSGEDATNLYRAKVLLVSLKMMVSSGGRMIPTRGFTMTYGLKLVSSYTQKKYKRTEAVRAMDDLKQWIATMESAIPIEVRK